MAWTTPVDYSTGQVITAAIWNDLIGAGGNIDETAPAKVTTAGDLVYGTGTNAIARLGIGSANTVLRSTGSAPAWGAVAATEITAANWKLFYSNGSGAVQELAMAASGVLTANGVSAAPTFEAAAAGGSKTMTASGIIASAGIGVSLNADGTVSTIVDGRIAAVYGNYYTPTSNAISITMTQVLGVYNANADAVVVFYPSNEWDGGGGGYKMYSAAASISGSTLTFGTPIEIPTTYSNWYGPYTMGIAYDPVNFKVWYVWHQTSDDAVLDINVATATVSGTTVTKTAQKATGFWSNNFGTSNNACMTWDSTNEQMVVALSNYSAVTCDFFVVSESGGTITQGSALQTTTANAATGIGNMVWLPTVARMVAWGGASTNRGITTISVSGTTLTLDQEDVFLSYFGSVGQKGHANFISTTTEGNKVIAGGLDKTTTYTTAWNIFTITAGSATTAAYASGQDMGLGATQVNDNAVSITRVGTSSSYVIQNAGDPSNFFGTIELAGVSTALPTLSIIGLETKEDPEVGELQGWVGTNCNDGWMGTGHSNKVLTTSRWRNPTYIQAGAAVLQPASGSTNAPAWVGLSETAIADGATGAITVVSGTNEGVSGLTTGKTYFMQADGSLAITRAVPTEYGVVGPALSATSILVQGVGDTTLTTL